MVWKLFQWYYWNIRDRCAYDSYWPPCHKLFDFFYYSEKCVSRKYIPWRPYNIIIWRKFGFLVFIMKVLFKAERKGKGAFIAWEVETFSLGWLELLERDSADGCTAMRTQCRWTGHSKRLKRHAFYMTCIYHNKNVPFREFWEVPYFKAVTIIA